MSQSTNVRERTKTLPRGHKSRFEIYGNAEIVAVKKLEYLFELCTCQRKLSLRARKGVAISWDQVRSSTPYREIPTVAALKVAQ